MVVRAVKIWCGVVRAVKIWCGVVRAVGGLFLASSDWGRAEDTSVRTPPMAPDPGRIASSRSNRSTHHCLQILYDDASFEGMMFVNAETEFGAADMRRILM